MIAARLTRPLPLCLHVEQHAQRLAELGRVSAVSPAPLQQLVVAGALSQLKDAGRRRQKALP